MPTLQDSFDTGDTTASLAVFGVEESADYRLLAQTFVAGSSYSIYSTELKIYKVGTLNGNVTVSIRATTGSPKVPTGSDLVIATILGTDLGTTADWEEAIFSSSLALTGGTTYAIVITAPDEDGTKNVRWRYKSTGGYSGGTYCVKDDEGGDNWGTSVADLMFRTYSVEVYSEGTLVATADASASIVSESMSMDEGTKVATTYCFAEISSEIFTGHWPPLKPDTNPDYVYDETAETWITVDSRGGSRYKEQLVVVGQNNVGNGVIYYASVEV